MAKLKLTLYFYGNMAGQEWSEVYVSLTIILCSLKLLQILITLQSENTWISYGVSMKPYRADFLIKLANIDLALEDLTIFTWTT